MNTAETKRKIDAAEERLSILRPWIERLEAARARAVKAFPDPSDTGLTAQRARATLRVIDGGADRGDRDTPLPAELVDGFRARLPGLNAARDEVTVLEEQVRALRAELPSPEQVEAAKADAAAARQQARRLEQAWAEDYGGLLDLLAKASEVAQRLARTGAAHRAAGEELERLAETWGVEGAQVKRLRADPGTAEQARLLVVIVQQALNGGDISAVTLAALAKSRRRARAA